MNNVVQSAVNEKLRYAEQDIQVHEMTIARLENDIQSRQAEIAWRKRRIEVIRQEVEQLKQATKPGKGKRNAKSASKSRRVRV